MSFNSVNNFGQVNAPLPSKAKLPYYLRLRKCGLLSLQDRRKRADMLEVFKIINGFTDMDTKSIFELSHTPPSRKTQQVNSSTPRHSRLDARHQFFSQRVIKPWNTLPSDCVNALTFNNFKTKYQNYCHNH